MGLAACGGRRNRRLAVGGHRRTPLTNGRPPGSSRGRVWGENLLEEILNDGGDCSWIDAEGVEGALGRSPEDDMVPDDAGGSSPARTSRDPFAGVADVGGSGGTPEASGGAPEAGPSGSAVLFIGDSMLSRADFRCDPPRRLWTRAIPGGTLRRWLKTGTAEVRRWLSHLDEGGRDDCQVILWLGGNDVYPRKGGFDAGTVAPTLNLLRQVVVDLQSLGCRVTLLGTTPRFLFDKKKIWEETKAYWMERALCELAHSTGASFLPLGRRLCARKGKKRQYYLQEEYFAGDEVHINAEGYRRLLPGLPGFRFLSRGADAR